MKTIDITEAKAQLSRLLKRVERGETLLIVHRGRPVARIEPVRASARGDDDALLASLERDGVVRRAALAPDAAVLDLPRPASPKGAELLTALIDEREEGR